MQGVIDDITYENVRPERLKFHVPNEHANDQRRVRPCQRCELLLGRRGVQFLGSGSARSLKLSGN